jgi:septal ring factor EnvC (AmiA/AmiB activator)
MRCALLAVVAASATADSLENAANPIRKVVTMLQVMQKKVEAEGERDKELFDKFMCYCKNAGGDLQKGISDSDTKLPRLAADIEEGEAKVVTMKEELKQAQTDRSAAKAAMAEATALREKEAAAYGKFNDEMTANIAAVAKAIKVIDAGMGGGFLQTEGATVLKKIAMDSQNLPDADRQEVLSFLSGSSDYAPASGEISGILKTMQDEMSKTLGDATSEENAAIATYDSLMASKKKEVGALTKEIEVKLTRVGELSVEIVQMKNDLTDTQEQLVEDKKFLANMEKDCAAKAGEYEVVVKTRQEELLALADTIKLLNDDDALELFKKTLPGASASFVEVTVSQRSIRKNALSFIQRAQTQAFVSAPQLDFIALAIRGKKVGFDKVIKLIDDMVATLKQEQLDDDHKEEYCKEQFDLSDDKKKGLEKTISDLETSITEAKESIQTLVEEIDALEDGIKALDKAVAEATEQRKEEHEDFTEEMSSNAAAKELLGFAKNRLNKFYNPKLYKPPAASFIQISKHEQLDEAAPPPPPEAVGAYKKKGEESNGVIAMIDTLVRDVTKEMTESETEEKDAQGDYEQMMSDSKEKRATDSKALTEKTNTKAQMETQLETSTEGKASAGKELMATEGYISSLHAECDWLLKYFDMRKEARAGEIDALEKAKAVLSGADYSLVQTKTNRFLQRA